MTATLLLLPQVLGTFLVADFVTGIVHWPTPRHHATFRNICG